MSSFQQAPSHWPVESAVALREAYRSGELSPVEVISATIEQIESLDPAMHAFTTTTFDEAMDAAKQAEDAYGRGDAGELAGIPTTVKDLTPTKGVRTTFGSLTKEHWVPEFDAPLVERLRDAGAAFLGKTSTPEFGWKAASGNRLEPRTVNPWDPSRTPGGSSSGAGAALAAGFGYLAQGSDGAGSVRIPASFCGVVGMKPSYGVIPHVPVALIGALAHLGPMARTVEDCALMLDVMQGADSRDPDSWTTSISLDQKPVGRKLRIGWLTDLGYARATPEIARVFDVAREHFAELGHELRHVEWNIPDPYELLMDVWSSGMAAHHAESYEVDAPLIDQGRRVLVDRGFALRGIRISSAARAFAQHHEAVREVMSGVDVLITPTVPCSPFSVEDDYPTSLDRPGPLGWAFFTYPFNITGQPAISVPCGLDSDGLPVGLQIVGAWRQDDLVLRLAAEFEQARGTWIFPERKAGQ